MLMFFDVFWGLDGYSHPHVNVKTPEVLPIMQGSATRWDDDMVLDPPWLSHEELLGY